MARKKKADRMDTREQRVDETAETASAPDGTNLDAQPNLPATPAAPARTAQTGDATRKGLAALIASLHNVENPAKIAFWLVVLVAGAFTLPYLGSVGFYDPWETHYGEVAREMAQRDDYIYPHWKNAYFFSKPILLFWLTAPGYALVGAGKTGEALPAAVEWVGRLPSALFGLSTVLVAFQVARRLWNLRAATFAALLLGSTPFWVFMSKQAITDMLYVAPMSMAILLLAYAFLHEDGASKNARIPLWLIGAFAMALIPQLWQIGRSGAFLRDVTLLGSESTTRLGASLLLSGIAAGALFGLRKFGRDPWLHAAAALVGLAVLAKGPHAVALTGLVFFLYLLVTGEWNRLWRVGFLTALPLFVAIAAPWYLVMYLFDGKDDERKTWFQRFVLHDLLNRATRGVHGDQGSSNYYVSYLSWGLFPIAPLFPVGLFEALRTGLARRADRTTAERFTLIIALWGFSFFAFFSFVTTKFHHYIFPVVVPAALLVGWLLDRLVRSAKGMAIGLGAIVSTGVMLLARDLTLQPWQWVDLFTYHYKNYKAADYFPKDINWHTTVAGIGFTVALLIIFGLVLDQLRDDDGERGLFSGLRSVFDAAVSGHVRTKNGGFVGMVLIGAMATGMFIGQVYFPRLSQHWSQRWLIDTYFAMRQEGEPLISYQMNWRGETFYAASAEDQVRNNGRLKRALKKPGRKFFLIEKKRMKNLKSGVGSKNAKKLRVINKSNTKWDLVLLDTP